MLDLLRSRAPLAGNGVLPEDLRLSADGRGWTRSRWSSCCSTANGGFGVPATGLLEGAPLTVGRNMADVRDAVAHEVAPPYL